MNPRVESGRGDHWAAWRESHRRAFFASLRRLAGRPWATVLTVTVMAVALALPLCLGLVLAELQRFSGSLRESRELAVFLQPGGDGAAATAFVESLGKDPEVAGVVLRSPDEGLAELRALDALGGALEVLDYNPLPWVALVEPTAAADDAQLAERLRAAPGVDFVQHDAQWRRRLGAWLGLGQRVTAVAALLLGLGVLLVVGNTVRLDIQDRQAEIATVRLLGASAAWIRRPFLYLGMLYGSLAGALALLLALAVQRVLAAPVSTLVDSYGGDFRLLGLTPQAALAALGAALLLGWLGARLAVGHHLREAARAEGNA